MQLRDPCEAAPALNFRERQVIAAVVRKNEIADEFSLVGEYFTDAACRRIFEAASIRLERGELFDEYSLASDLEPAIRSHLMAMIEELPGDFGMIAPYAAGLRGGYLKRGARAVAESLAAATNSTEEPEAIIDAAQARLDELQEGRGSARACRVGEAAFRVQKSALEAKCNGIPPGIASGILPLDELLQRLRGGQLIIGAGGTGSGKTSLATNIAANLARLGIAVSYFTLEMGAEDIAVRLIAGETGIPVGEILSGRLSQDEVSRIQQATQEIDGWPLHIERCNVLDARQLMRRGRQLKRKHGIKLIVVDYLQLMRERGRSFYEQVSEVTRGLKIAAGELDLPVLALSQLSRETERRADGVKVEDRHLKRRPKLSESQRQRLNRAGRRCGPSPASRRGSPRPRETFDPRP